MTDQKLPAWAKLAEHQPEGYIPRINVDAGAMYAAWLAEFAGMKLDLSKFPARKIIRGGKTVEVASMTKADACDPAKPTQYWLECAFQCMKLELQAALGFGLDIRVSSDADKTWKLDRFPAGRTWHAATFALEAKKHFKALRGSIPE